MNTTLLPQKHFMGAVTKLGRSNGSRVNALFKRSAKQGTQQLKKAAAPAKKAVQKAKPGTQTIKKAQAPIRKATPAPRGKLSSSSYGRGDQRDQLWLPNAERPAWLDGSMPGDRGFDPLGLSAPKEYLQVDLDQLDQNVGVNKAGQIVGKYSGVKQSNDSLAPYDDVFGLDRFRETELIHGRWAMLAALGVLVGEASTGVSWADAGKVELDGAQYLGFRLPFTITQLVWIEAILVGGAEIYRNRERNPERRLYPGGVFDPLGLASGDDEKAFRLKTAEIKHGRLAMVAFLGFGVQALATGKGALGSLASFANTFGLEEVVEDIEKAL
jgi:light-harvesting complex II chlorophyll a/b binding protein 4